METWILHFDVDPKKKYWYDLDGALNSKKLRGTIYQAQNTHIKNISVGDIVYLYENAPVKVIGWKCRVIAVKIPYEKTSDINDSEFEHGYSEPDDFYIKITALAKYDDESRENLSLAKLRDNGLTQERSNNRVNPQLLRYINSIKASPVLYDD